MQGLKKVMQYINNFIKLLNVANFSFDLNLF